MITYGFSRMTILKLTNDLVPEVGAEKVVIEGSSGKGATSSFDLTGLAKTPSKVFGSNIAYFLARKGYGDVAANFGILDVPYELDHEMAGHQKTAGGVRLLGKDTEPPHYAILVESEDYESGDKVGFGIFAGTFGRGAYAVNTIGDDDFTPEADDYVCTPIAKEIDGVDEPQIVGFALGDKEFSELNTLLFGKAPDPETRNVNARAADKK